MVESYFASCVICFVLIGKIRKGVGVHKQISARARNVITSSMYISDETWRTVASALSTGTSDQLPTA
jgi:hypothetical protein